MDKIDDEILFPSIKVYVNNSAKYWAADFLEVREAKTDAVNTKAVLHATDMVLRSVKETSLQDYYNLRNTVVHELQSEQIINYPDMVSNLLDTYEPASDKINVADIKEKMLSAREKGGFDSQFHTDPKSIKGSGKITISVSPSIDVRVKEGIPNWEASFLVHEKANGRTFLMIRCNDQKTLSSFPMDED